MGIIDKAVRVGLRVAMETRFYNRYYNKIKVSIKETCCMGSGVRVSARSSAL